MRFLMVLGVQSRPPAPVVFLPTGQKKLKCFGYEDYARKKERAGEA